VKYSVVTFGCRVNHADSLGFEEELRAAGALAAAPVDADVVIVNSCSVTARADQGARQAVRRIARDNPHARIIVTGCYATRCPDDVAALPHVAQLVANDDKPRLVALIDVDAAEQGVERPGKRDRATEAIRPGLRGERFGVRDGDHGRVIEPGIAGRTAFSLCVQTGCAESCAYCIVPATRGRPRSAPTGDVMRSVDRVVAAGFKEIAVAGVHLGSYGRDLTPPASLAGLLHALAARDLRGADVRFRIGALEPMDCGRDVVDLVVSSTRFAPHFHLPLQHASDRMLAAMRRSYTIDTFAELVGEIRRRIPWASIGTDVMVGFPGERDEDFQALTSYLEGSPLTYLHVFPYSGRPGTAASMMAEQAGATVVRERARQVRAIGHRLANRFGGSQVGSVHRAITIEDGSLAVTGNYLKVRIPPGRARNEWVSARITAAGATMAGEVVERSV
jgi:threonylcarbamoyladenosine tRNA methylthiotransferase MtaB